MFKPSARNVDNPPFPSRQNLPNDQIRQQKMANMVQPELHFNAVFRRLEIRNSHHASTVDEVVDLLNAGIDL